MKIITPLTIFLLIHFVLGAQQEQPRETVINFNAAYNLRVLDKKPFHGVMADITMYIPRPLTPSVSLWLTVRGNGKF